MLKLNLVEAEDNSNPFINTKKNLLSKLDVQLKCAEALVNSTTYMQTVKVDGKDVQKPYRKWFWRDQDQKIRFVVKVGNKKLLLDKKNSDILVSSEKELPVVIKQIIDAVQKGEIDGLLKEIVDAKKRKA